jgi:sulfane dehydrogenase subunit SoxC
VKWLRQIKVVDQPYMTREETSKYTDLMPDGRARQFTFLMEAKSVITRPSAGQRLNGPGFYEISGLAWSGSGAITRAEVSIDAGATWTDATLQLPVLPKAHTRFTAPWTWDGREVVLVSRCTDESGYVQPARAELVATRGINSNYHCNATQGWRINADGTIVDAAL